jgi:hypothetical protein
MLNTDVRQVAFHRGSEKKLFPHQIAAAKRRPDGHNDVGHSGLAVLKEIGLVDPSDVLEEGVIKLLKFVTDKLTRVCKGNPN